MHFLIQIIKGSQPFNMETVYHINLFESKQGRRKVAKAFLCFYSKKGKKYYSVLSFKLILKEQK